MTQQTAPRLLEISLEDIAKEVVNHMAISRGHMYSLTRDRRGAYGRAIVGYLPRELTGHSSKSVAEHFGRDPVAISQGVEKLESRLGEDENLRCRINEPTEDLAKGRKRILI